MKVITKTAQLYSYMDARRKAKKWKHSQLEAAVGSKTGFNKAVAPGPPIEMKIGTILRLLDTLGLEMVIRIKEPPPPAPRTFVPTNVLPSGATPPPEGAREA